MQSRLLVMVLAASCAMAAALPLGAQNAAARPDARAVAVADSMNREARSALNRGDYRGAAALFGQLQRRYPDTEVARSALYWQAFSLYRSGNPNDLRSARSALSRHLERYPDVMTADVQSLMLRVEGSLAQMGDPNAAEAVVARAAPAAPAAPGAPAPAAAPAAPVPGAVAEPRPAAAPAHPRAPSSRRGAPPGCVDEDHEVRVAALQALMQVDADRALPILQQTLQRRDPCSVELRRHAVFLVQQKGGAQRERILLDVVRNDPDDEVRGQAVHWLGNVNSETAIDALQEILRSNDDPQLQQRALFALSQNRNERGRAILRQVAEDESASTELRGQAVFWLGQRRGTDGEYLRTLYTRIRNEQIRERILHSLSQSRDEADRRWLMELALRESEPMELRKRALFWAGQQRTASAELVALYDRVDERELKEQLIYLYAQRRSEETTTKLIELVRGERDQELRKRAIFWLSQSRDPRATEVLREVIAP